MLVCALSSVAVAHRIKNWIRMARRSKAWFVFVFERSIKVTAPFLLAPSTKELALRNSTAAGPGGERPFRRLFDFEEAVVLRQPLGLPNRPIFELIRSPSARQVRRPVVFCFSAANAQRDRPPRGAG